MIQTYLKRFWYAVLLVAMQALVLGHIHLWGYATPLLGVLFILHLPLNANRIGCMCASFVIGLILDMFSNSPGVAATAMTLTCFVQQPLLKNMVPKDAEEDLVPAMYSMGNSHYIWYVVILMLLFVVTYFLVEAMSFFNVLSLLISIASSCALSFVLVMSLEVFRRKG